MYLSIAFRNKTKKLRKPHERFSCYNYTNIFNCIPVKELSEMSYAKALGKSQSQTRCKSS